MRVNRFKLRCLWYHIQRRLLKWIANLLIRPKESSYYYSGANQEIRDPSGYALG